MMYNLQLTIYHLRRRKFWLAGLAGLVCVGCTTAPVGSGAFQPLSERAAERVLAEIAGATSGWQLVKYRMDCRVELPATSTRAAATETFTATCVWEPGRRLRLRVRRFRMSVADVLFDGKHWYFTDEVNQRAYRTRAIGRVRVATIPRVFFRQLQHLPDGWINPLEPHNVAEAAQAYRVETITDVFSRWMIFPRGAPVPSEVMLTTPNGSALYAALSAPDTNVSPHAAMFVPNIAGYECYDLDTGERLTP